MNLTDFQNGYALGLASGGIVEVPAKEEQEKTVTITENGTTEILPDEDKALSKVTVVTDIESNGIDISVEYIESTGTQYIDTGIIPTNHRVVAKFECTDTSDNKTAFGVNYDVGSFDFTRYNNKWYWLAGGSQSSFNYENPCEIDFNNNKNEIIVNGKVVVSNTNGTTTANKNLFIFSRPVNSRLYAISMKLYYFKIYDRATEELVRDFVPAIDENGVICLFDKVTEAYFYNQGSGEFKGNFIEKGLAEVETLIDSSGVLDSTEGTVTEKVEQLIEKAQFTGIKLRDFSYGVYKLPTEAYVNIPYFLSASEGFAYLFANQSAGNNGGLYIGLKKVYFLKADIEAFAPSMFLNCVNLEELIGDFANIKRFGGNAFSSCKALKKIPYCPQLQTISNRAFDACIGLTNVNLPNTITTIHSGAFSNCFNITDIYCPWGEGAVANAPWGATNATIHYNYVEGEATNAES